MIGVVIEEMFPNILKSPPLRPAISLGQVSEITAQPSAPMPLPKERKSDDHHDKPLRIDVVADDGSARPGFIPSCPAIRWPNDLSFNNRTRPPFARQNKVQEDCRQCPDDHPVCRDDLDRGWKGFEHRRWGEVRDHGETG